LASMHITQGTDEATDNHAAEIEDATARATRSAGPGSCGVEGGGCSREERGSRVCAAHGGMREPGVRGGAVAASVERCRLVPVRVDRGWWSLIYVGDDGHARARQQQPSRLLSPLYGIDRQMEREKGKRTGERGRERHEAEELSRAGRRRPAGRHTQRAPCGGERKRREGEIKDEMCIALGLGTWGTPLWWGSFSVKCQGDFCKMVRLSNFAFLTLK
jgi:hypothetical protein